MTGVSPGSPPTARPRALRSLRPASLFPGCPAPTKHVPGAGSPQGQLLALSPGSPPTTRPFRAPCWQACSRAVPHPTNVPLGKGLPWLPTSQDIKAQGQLLTGILRLSPHSGTQTPRDSCLLACPQHVPHSRTQDQGQLLAAVSPGKGCAAWTATCSSSSRGPDRALADSPTWTTATFSPSQGLCNPFRGDSGGRGLAAHPESSELHPGFLPRALAPRALCLPRGRQPFSGSTEQVASWKPDFCLPGNVICPLVASGSMYQMFL